MEGMYWFVLLCVVCLISPKLSFSLLCADLPVFSHANIMQDSSEMMMPPYIESVIPPTTGALTHKSTQACILQ
jgi:hypothetical protein